MPVINTYQDYQNLPHVQLVAGDILLKKVFPETCKSTTEWGITTGQKLFSGDKTIKTGGIFSREKFKIAYQGSHTSEHAAVAIAADEIAEAVGEGVITASIVGRRDERYCVYRCSVPELRDAAIMIARGLSTSYHHVVQNDHNIRNTTGGQYSIKGAIQSNFRHQTFQHDTTNNYLTHIVDYVLGVRNDRPNMFCSEFSMTCYEAGSLAARGKTAFGTNPLGMSPMHLEDALNSRPDIMTLVGRYDSENDVLFSGVEAALRNYKHQKHWWNSLGKSEQSTRAVETLHNLLLIGDNDYLLAAVAAFLNMQPAVAIGVRCTIPQDWRLSQTSTLYASLTGQPRLMGLLIR